jgi:hypothetical protein
MDAPKRHTLTGGKPSSGLPEASFGGIGQPAIRTIGNIAIEKAKAAQMPVTAEYVPVFLLINPSPVAS